MPAESLEREIRDLRAALYSERDPDGRAFAPLADALRRAGDLARALELVEDGVRRLPGFATGHVVSGWVHRARGDDGRAEGSFRRVLELDGENVSALRGLGFLLADRGDDAEALEIFRRLDELEPGDLEVRARLLELGGRTGLESARESAASMGFPASEEGSRPLVDIAVLGPDEGPRPLVHIARLAPDEGVAPAGRPGEGAAPVPGPESGRPLVDIGVLAPDREVARPVVDVETLEPEGRPQTTAGAPEAAEATEAAPDADVPARKQAEAPGPSTRTMAELYVGQGLTDRALDIYRRLVERSPEDEGLRARLEELEADVAAGGPEGREKDLEDLARHMATGPALADEPEGPFAWGGGPGAEEDRDEEGRTDDSGASVTEYFRSLLEWRPAGGAAEGGAPGGEGEDGS